MVLKSRINRFKDMNHDYSNVILNNKVHQGNSLLEWIDFYGMCCKERYLDLAK